MKYFSMFTGIGGFELGIKKAFENTGSKSDISEGRKENTRGLENLQGHRNKSSNEEQCQCVGYSEIDKYSIQTYEKNFGKEVKNYGNATTIKPEELPDFDLLCGGFPCQAFSVAGKRRGFADTRGTLFFDIARILKVKRPKFIFLENVKGLLNHEKGKTFSVIIQALEELGYRIEWMVLNSKFFGVPQNRERVFIIGSLRGTSRSEVLPFGETKTKFNSKGIIHPTITGAIGRQGSSKEYIQSLKMIIRGRPNIPYEHGKRELNYTIYKDTCPTLSQNCASGDQKNIVMPMIQRVPLRFLSRNQKNIEGDYSFTVDSSHTGGIYDGKFIRRLTPIECERLQGYPDNWTEGVSNTQRYKQLGNAVTVNVIQAIMEKWGIGK